MIPTEAVEAAAKAIFAQQYDPDEWTRAVAGMRDRCKRDARAALEAAAPHMLGDAKPKEATVVRVPRSAVTSLYRPTL